MIFEITLLNGPLDGERLQGDAAEPDANQQLSWVADLLRFSLEGIVGAMVEIIAQPASKAFGGRRRDVRLHSYRIVRATPFSAPCGVMTIPVFLELQAEYVRTATRPDSSAVNDRLANVNAATAVAIHALLANGWHSS